MSHYTHCSHCIYLSWVVEGLTQLLTQQLPQQMLRHQNQQVHLQLTQHLAVRCLSRAQVEAHSQTQHVAGSVAVRVKPALKGARMSMMFIDTLAAVVGFFLYVCINYVLH